LRSTRTTATTSQSESKSKPEGLRSGGQFAADIEGAEAVKRAKAAQRQFNTVLKELEHYQVELATELEHWNTFNWEKEEDRTLAKAKVQKLQQAVEVYEEIATQTTEYKKQFEKKRTAEERITDSQKYNEIWEGIDSVQKVINTQIKELKDLAKMPGEVEEVASSGKISAKIPTPSKFAGKPSECTTSWLRQWKQQVEDYFYLTQLQDNDQQMIFLPNCLEEGAKKFYYGFRALHGPKNLQIVKSETKGKQPEEKKDSEWNLDSFFKALKEVYVPVNHIQDQMDEWANIKQGAPG
jgi:hypothetical protein